MDLVIDKGVLIAAFSMQNPNTKQKDLSALILIVDVISCKHNIRTTNQIQHVYWTTFDEMKGGRYGPMLINVPKLFNEALNSNKVISSGGSEANFAPVPHEDRIKDEDRKFARLAYHTNSILVTYDFPLMQIFGQRAKEPGEVQ
jgi:hypothetical protein